MKPIVENFYDSIYFDEEEYVMKFHTEFQAVVDVAAITTHDLIITVQDIDRGIAAFGNEKAAGKDDVSADVFKYFSVEDKHNLAHHFYLRMNGQCPTPETLHASTCVLLPKYWLPSSSSISDKLLLRQWQQDSTMKNLCISFSHTPLNTRVTRLPTGKLTRQVKDFSKSEELWQHRA